MSLVRRLLASVKDSDKRVFVVGDAITDLWIHGAVEACQDGCPKFVEASRWSSPGGAANAYHCLDHWTAEAILQTYTGDANPIKCRFVGPDGGIMMRWDDDWRGAEERASYKWARETTCAAISQCASAVLLSDYDKGFLDAHFIRAVIDLCAMLDIPCVADAKRESLAYEGSIIKCNNDWWNLHGIKNSRLVAPVVRTFGCSAPDIYLPDGDVRDINDLPPVQCVNHVGAGDCFAAHLTLALAHGFSLEDAATLAHSAGRVYVQHEHNRPPLPAEIEADLEGGCATESKNPSDPFIHSRYWTP